MDRIHVIIDAVSGRAPASSLELISFARYLSEDSPREIIVIVAGEDPAALADELACFGHRVIALAHSSFRFPNPELLARECLRIAGELPPRYLCLPHTMRGCQVAAHIAVEAGWSCVTAVESFRRDEGAEIVSRSMYNGKIIIDLTLPAAPAVVTVLPGSYRRPEAGETAKSPIETRRATSISPATPLSIEEAAAETERLEEADVIVAAGRGIGSRENLELIHAVARLFPNSAVGASRSLCDLKWLPHARQVGVTGKTVSPRLYLACGISGAQQHDAGMKGSQLVVAVNRDPRAAIFDISDYIIVEDLARFLPALLEQHGKIYSPD